MSKYYMHQISKYAFSFQHDKPVDFSLSSWQKGHSPVPMLLVRCALTVLSLAMLVWSLVDDGATGHWWIYLTNWGLLLILFTTFGGFFISAASLCQRLPEIGETPWFVRVYWLLYNITLPTTFLITIFYWSLLYGGENGEGYNLWLDIATHGGNSAIMLVELLVSRTPSRFMHFYQSLSFGAVYSLFSYIYYAAGGTDREGNVYIYTVLDWSQYGQTLIVLVATAAAFIVIYCTMVCVALLRDSLSTSLVRKTGHDLPRAPEYDLERNRV